VLDVEAVAAIAHGANAALQDWARDPYAAVPWFGATPHTRDSYMSGIRFALDYLRDNSRLPTAREQHERWLAWHAERGWSWGDAVDEREKTHSDMVPWEELSRAQQLKDELFLHIVLWAVIIGVNGRHPTTERSS